MGRAILLISVVVCSILNATCAFSFEKNIYFPIRAISLVNRLNSLDKCINVFISLDQKLKTIVDDPAMQNEEEINKIKQAFAYLAKFVEIEIQGDPLEDSYQANIDEFEKNISQIYPSIFPPSITAPYLYLKLERLPNKRGNGGRVIQEWGDVHK